jgi:sugar (pentulose or hexulose) kinase
MDDVAAVVEQGSILVPPLGDDGGPFDGNPRGGPGGTPTQNDEQAVARASVYLALMTDYCFDLLKAKGPVIVEGSLTGNHAFLGALASLRRSESVMVSSDATGTVSGAVLLAGSSIPDEPELVEPIDLPMAEYKQAWREALPA